MALSQVLAERIPYLRRYARALTGSQQSGDAYVRSLLEAALTDDGLREQIGQGRVSLYRAFTRIWASSHVELVPAGGHEEGGKAIAQERLERIPPQHRQALLLTTLEGFSDAEAGLVLDLSVEEVGAMVERAVEELRDEEPAKVLIIEDEPLISMQLEELVASLGHTVVAVATTRSEAVEAFRQTAPSLLLVDIQLGDGSSGIDAVQDILRETTVPVIFITAYPERMLTGERPEPTYLITKPFLEETVRATISQALFFGTTSSLD